MSKEKTIIIVIVIVAIVSGVILFGNFLSGKKRTYTQIVKPKRGKGGKARIMWPKINHTLVKLSDNRLKSTLTVTAVKEPPLDNVNISLHFYEETYLVPEIVGGKTSKVVRMEKGDTVKLTTLLEVKRLSKEAYKRRIEEEIEDFSEQTYFLGGSAIAFSNETNATAGKGTKGFFIVVGEDGKIKDIKKKTVKPVTSVEREAGGIQSIEGK